MGQLDLDVENKLTKFKIIRIKDNKTLKTYEIPFKEWQNVFYCSYLHP